MYFSLQKYGFPKNFFVQKILVSFNRVQIIFYNQRSNSFITVWNIGTPGIHVRVVD